MKKKVFGRKFSRDYGSRQALLRALMRSLIHAGSIDTSKAKAKAVQPDIDALVNLVKEKSVSSLRRAYAILGNDRESLSILSTSVAPVFSGRISGYTRIIPLPVQAGDASERARLEWVDKVEIKTKIQTTKSKKETKKEEPEKKGMAKLLKKVGVKSKNTEKLK
jgi:large subunit ribosomal protein L17